MIFLYKVPFECRFIRKAMDACKNEPPIITINKYINHKFEGESFVDIPILDMLLVKEKRIVEKFG